jgi:hypothetical protein
MYSSRAWLASVDTLTAVADEVVAGAEVEPSDQQPVVLEDRDDPPLCYVCRQELSRTPSAASKAIGVIWDVFFGFFARLFSSRGRGLRWFLYICLAAYLGGRLWTGPGRRWWSRSGPFSWARWSDHRWAVAACVCVVVLLVIYGVRRRRLVKRGIKSPPWLLILVVAGAALGVSAAAGFLLYRFAPDGSAKFDAVKTALTMFAGAAGVGALVLSFRTHFTGETDRINNQFDTAAQKLTEKSPVVQSAGLVALQRIGRRHPAYRAAAAHVVHAYICVVDDAEPEQQPVGSGGEHRSSTTKNRFLAGRILDEFGAAVLW